jgi:hypothetical protein
LREVTDPRERGKVVNAAWRRYGTVNSLALAALLAGWTASRVGEPDRRTLSERERALVVARDAAVGTVAVTGVAAGIQGMRFSKMEPEGAIRWRTAARQARAPRRARAVRNGASTSSEPSISPRH